MNRRNHKWYVRTYWFKQKIANRYTQAGLFILIAFMLMVLFGLNTQKTMIYQIITLLFPLLFISWLSTKRKRINLSVIRHLPRYCTVDETVTYEITLKNNGKQREVDLYYVEEPADPCPDYNEFISTPEKGEEKRNWFDRKMGYYRWSWLVKEKLGAKYEEVPIPPLVPGESVDISYTLKPYRRGYIRLAGSRISKRDLFNFRKSGHVVSQEGSVLVLPKIYAINPPYLPGSRKYHQGGVVFAQKVGNSEEFMELREYQPGDPLKHIHWKTFAKTGTPMVRQYQDEFFARYGLILDTFTHHAFSDVLEGAVSTACSLIVSMEGGEEIIDLMFVGTETFCFSCGRGVGEVDRMLEILATVQPCRNKVVKDLENLVTQRISLLSGVMVIFIDFDEQRKELLHLLQSMKVNYIALLLTDNPNPYRKDEDIKKYNVKVISLDALAKELVQL